MRVRRICICADDFGLDDGINRAVVSLAARGRISATSFMVKRPAARSGADLLKVLSPYSLEIGLHLDLEGIAGGAHGMHTIEGDGRLFKLIAASYLGRLDRDRLREEIRDQFSRFEALTGRTPDFVDGHRHVHQLPVVRDLLLDEIAARYRSALPWVRSTRPSRRMPLQAKAECIYALGGKRFRESAVDRGIPLNRSLLGVHGFTDNIDEYRARIQEILRNAQDGDLLMCHPSLGSPASDRLAKARLIEYSVLEDLDISDPAWGEFIVLGSVSRSFTLRIPRIHAPRKR